MLVENKCFQSPNITTFINIFAKHFNYICTFYLIKFIKIHLFEPLD